MTNWMIGMGQEVSLSKQLLMNQAQHVDSQPMRNNRPCWLIGVAGSPPTWVMLLDLLGLYVMNTQVGGETITYQSGR